MKRRILSPLRVRNLEFGGEQPLFCIPIVPHNMRELAAQAEIAHKLKPELIEWRADFFSTPTTTSLVEGACLIRETAPTEPIIFTLRAKNEGGAQEIPQSERRVLIEAVLRSSTIDLVDLELANDEEFLNSMMQVAKQYAIPVILAFHDFERTGDDDFLLSKIESMRSHAASIGKIAVMPQSHEDVLRLLHVTARARTLYPTLPLITMAMGALGSITRTAGFLFGSDMSFALGQSGSAPGQIPMEDARKLTEMLLRYS